MDWLWRSSCVGGNSELGVKDPSQTLAYIIVHTGEQLKTMRREGLAKDFDCFNSGYKRRIRHSEDPHLLARQLVDNQQIYVVSIMPTMLWILG